MRPVCGTFSFSPQGSARHTGGPARRGRPIHNEKSSQVNSKRMTRHNAEKEGLVSSAELFTSERQNQQRREYLDVRLFTYGLSCGGL
jgi:hypothetical protein